MERWTLTQEPGQADEKDGYRWVRFKLWCNGTSPHKANYRLGANNSTGQAVLWKTSDGRTLEAYRPDLHAAVLEALDRYFNTFNHNDFSDLL